MWQEKIIISVQNQEEIDNYRAKKIKNFLLPLKDFCVGYNDLYIDGCQLDDGNFYLLINRILDSKDIIKLTNILKNMDITNIKGIFFEDLGVLKIINDLKLPLEKIYFPNHFATNYASINLFLEKGIDSVVISNEITKDEVKQILNKVKEPVVLQVLGYNQIMYSRRHLISNFASEYQTNLAKDAKIREHTTDKCLKIKENNFGTVIFDEPIYNNLELVDLNDSKVKFYYINTTDLNYKLVMNALENNIIIPNSKNGFLNQKTIYKLGGKNE